MYKLLLTFLIIFLGFLFLDFSTPNNAYITNQGDDTVSVINLDKLKLETTIKVGNKPLGITILKKKSLAFVGNIESQNLSIINLKSNKIVKTLPLNATPLGLTHNSDESEIYITDWFNNQILIISSSTLKITGKIQVGKTPSGIAFNKEKNLLIISNRDENKIEIYSAKNHILKKTISVGRHPYGISSSGNYIFTANVYDDSVSIININTWNVRHVEVGHHPYNVIINDGLLFVTNSLDDNISVISLDSLHQIDTIKSGETPENLWVDKKNNQLVITNWGSDSITVVDLKNFKVKKEISSGKQSRAFGDFIVN